MRLNMNCIRDIMLTVEDYATVSSAPLVFVDNSLSEYKSFSNESSTQLELEKIYSQNELIYHLVYCVEAGILLSDHKFFRGAQTYCVYDLTVKGHDFLGNIRNKTLYEKILKITDKVGAYSLPAFQSTASLVVSELIKNTIGYS